MEFKECKNKKLSLKDRKTQLITQFIKSKSFLKAAFKFQILAAIVLMNVKDFANS